MWKTALRVALLIISGIAFFYVSAILIYWLASLGFGSESGSLL